jgi:hypothetical protein
MKTLNELLDETICPHCDTKLVPLQEVCSNHTPKKCEVCGMIRFCGTTKNSQDLISIGEGYWSDFEGSLETFYIHICRNCFDFDTVKKLLAEKRKKYVGK